MMNQKKVWKLVELPKGKNVIQGLWLFKKKYRVDGIGSKFKARFLAMGITQKEGVDYGDTFRPTGKPFFFETSCFHCWDQGWDIHQMDAVSAFLNVELDEDLYLEQPKVFVSGKEDFVCMLSNYIYRLRQSPKIWGDTVK